MKFYIKSLYLFCAVAMLAACGDFGDLNVNPNAPTKVGTETLLTSAQRTISSAVGAIGPELFVQHMSEITYTEESRYQDVIADFNGWYTGALANLQHIIDLNTNPETAGDVLSGGSNANQIGVARIMRAYYFDILVQRWGPVPYFDALKGGETLSPAYDTEVSIYTDLFKELDEASAQLGAGSILGDIVLGGDTGEWKKFANTLKAKIALRLSDVDEGTAKAKFVEALNAGIFDKTVVYQYLEETANQNPWYARFVTRTDFALSNTLYDFMTATNDDRLVNFVDPAASSGEIVAMPYGLENSEVSPADVSFPNSTYVRAQGVGIPIFSLAQIEFMLAEASARGWISDDAEAHYNTAIAASMNQWGIDDADAIAKFIAQDNVAYDASNWKQSIALQKWVALYTQGYDAWVNWRKLDFPILTPAENPLNVSGQIPLRNMYPETEATVNEASYKAIISSFAGGSDSDGIRLYWDVN